MVQVGTGAVESYDILMLDLGLYSCHYEFCDTTLTCFLYHVVSLTLLYNSASWLIQPMLSHVLFAMSASDYHSQCVGEKFVT